MHLVLHLLVLSLMLLWMVLVTVNAIEIFEICNRYLIVLSIRSLLKVTYLFIDPCLAISFESVTVTRAAVFVSILRFLEIVDDHVFRYIPTKNKDSIFLSYRYLRIRIRKDIRIIVVSCSRQSI